MTEEKPKYIILGKEDELNEIKSQDLNYNTLKKRLGLSPESQFRLATIDSLLYTWYGDDYEKVFYTGSPDKVTKGFYGDDLSYPKTESPEHVKKSLEAKGIPYQEINLEELLKCKEPKDQLTLF
jgi:hypothetical protein